MDVEAARKALEETGIIAVYGLDGADEWRARALSLRDHLTAALDEVERLGELAERLKLETQIHASESKTANATIYACYQAVTGSTGEPGNWNGAQPVVESLTALREKAERLEGLILRLASDEPRISEIITGLAGEKYGTFHVTVQDFDATRAEADRIRKERKERGDE